WTGGSMTALPVDIARCINDSDQYVGSVGYYWVSGGFQHSASHAFLVSGGTLTDLGDVGGGVKTNTEAFGLSNLGLVTGYSTAADGVQHAFLWGNGEMDDLGTFPGYGACGLSVNDAGVVVGNINTYTGFPIGSFLESGGAMHQLQDLLDASGAG